MNKELKRSIHLVNKIKPNEQPQIRKLVVPSTIDNKLTNIYNQY